MTQNDDESEGKGAEQKFVFPAERAVPYFSRVIPLDSLKTLTKKRLVMNHEALISFGVPRRI